MAKKDSFSSALIRRLPFYFRVLIKFYSMDKMSVTSEELAKELHLTPSQVRADIKAIGCQGQRSYGYGIPALYKCIVDILQLSDKFGAVIVGNSSIAKAISETPIFSRRGVKLLGRFADDENSEKGFLPFSELENFLSKVKPEIIIIAGKEENAEKILEYAEKLPKDNKEVFEIWNFSDTELYSEMIKVKNVHLADVLMMLCLEAGNMQKIDF